jgi:type 1 glutamine amidotransferase
VHVLATVDESTYTGGMMGGDHPLVWCHQQKGARAFFTSLGHPEAAWQEPEFRAHVRGALRWVAGLDGESCD